jgi:RluA family pseudouridine synthase
VNIIFSDNHILVLNKPAGLSILPDGWDQDSPYLVKQLEEQFGKIWVVHRLDKVTSGVMVFAHTAEAHRELNRQFEHHQAEKIYRVIALGAPEWDEKIARQPLRVNVGHKHRTIVDIKSGKPSETRFKVLERFPSYSLLEARPVTGRTHQVRVHAFALGYPLLGDRLYGASESELIARPALHACSLTLSLPQTDHWSLDSDHWSLKTFTAPYPEDFEIALKQITYSE